MQDPSLLLLEILARRLPPAARPWQDRVEAITGVRRGEAPDRYLAETLAAFDSAAFLATFTAAPRVLGKALLALDASEREMLAAGGVTWSIDGWRLDELGRAAMLAVASLRLPFKELERLLGTCYQQGDSRERQALLRALPFMEGPERFVALAIDACRTNEIPLFEAIACENPYPAAHFPDLSFNQMVLKAMFMGIALDRIVGLERRKSSELARMARDYAAERRAAGRSLPADIGLLYSEEGDQPSSKIAD